MSKTKLAKPYHHNETQAARFLRVAAKLGWYAGKQGSRRAHHYTPSPAVSGISTQDRIDQWERGYDLGIEAGSEEKNPFGCHP